MSREIIILQARFEVQSMQLDWTFLLCRELVNIPVQEGNATSRIIASGGEFDLLVSH